MDEDNFILRDGDMEKIEDVRKRYGNKPIVFFVGRHIQYKGLPHLIEAEKYVHSDCAFVIAGQGPLTERLDGAGDGTGEAVRLCLLHYPVKNNQPSFCPDFFSMRKQKGVICRYVA